MKRRRVLTWRAAVAGGALVGFGIGGFVLGDSAPGGAEEDDPPVTATDASPVGGHQTSAVVIDSAPVPPTAPEPGPGASTTGPATSAASTTTTTSATTSTAVPTTTITAPPAHPVTMKPTRAQLAGPSAPPAEVASPRRQVVADETAAPPPAPAASPGSAPGSDS